MPEPFRSWKHVFKLDPERSISDESLEKICLSGTDAVMVGGSTGVTYDNTVDLLARIRRYSLPCVCEVSEVEAVVPGFDLYFIPYILNAGDPEWIVGRHVQAVRNFRKMVPWSKTVTEAYVILNGDSAAARVTSATADIELPDVLAYAELADKLFRADVFYLEYSGKFGNPEWVRKVKETLDNAHLFYGGGINSYEKARIAAEAADTIIVGNVIYDDLQQALETVRTVRQPV